uniref:Telomere length regulation protein conserved domain-containing protein n=1 Tax=Aegilops tauschii subsp. strangulata TaxID=200361 RepID=A0A452ZQG4_AEGTS
MCTSSHVKLMCDTRCLCIFNDPSLEPYDLSDDDTNLQKNFTHLSDLAAALRKHDHRDGVESALSSAEKLVRASPDELCHCSGDLVQARVHVPCFRVKVEGEEDPAEENRQKALVALLHEHKLMDVSASPEGDAPCNMKNTIWTKGRYTDGQGRKEACRSAFHSYLFQHQRLNGM